MVQGTHYDSDQSISQNWLLQTWRLTRWNLFLLSRRLSGRLALIILVVGFLLMVTGMSASALLVPRQFAPDAANTLTFPLSLHLAELYIRFVGIILVCILAGVQVGSEFTFGTQRQMLTRGLSRVQILTAQCCGLAITALFFTAFLLIISILVGLVVGPALGSPVPALSAGTWSGLLMYFLALSAKLFIYMLLAFACAVVGRSPIAGVALPLSFFLLENILSNLLSMLSHNTQPATITPFTIYPLLLPGNNTAVLTNAATALYAPGSQSVQPMLAALAFGIFLAYCAIFCGASFFAYSRRDITE